MADLISSFRSLVTADKATMQLQKLILLEVKKACIALFYQIQALLAEIEQSTSFRRLKIFYLLILDFSSDMPK